MTNLKFDFSGASKVKESLKDSLMARYELTRGNKQQLDDDMLDYAAAAGFRMGPSLICKNGRGVGGKH